MATEYGIGVSTICDIRWVEEKIRSFYLSMENNSSVKKKRKIVRNASDEARVKAGKLKTTKSIYLGCRNDGEMSAVVQSVRRS